MEVRYFTKTKTPTLNNAPKIAPFQCAFLKNIPRMKIPAKALPKRPMTSWKKKNNDLTG